MPVPRAAVAAGAPSDSFEGWKAAERAVTGDLGEVHLHVGTPVASDLSVVADGWPPWFESGVLTSSPERVEVVLDPPATISGHVTTPSGEPLAGVEVVAKRSGGRWAAFATSATWSTRMPAEYVKSDVSASDGSFEIRGVHRSSRYQLGTSGAWLTEPAVTSVVAPVEGLELPVVPATGITLKCLDGVGATVGDRSVSVRIDVYAPAGSEDHRSTYRFVNHGGDIRLRFPAPDDRSSHVLYAVTLTPDGSPPVAFEVPATAGTVIELPVVLRQR